MRRAIPVLAFVALASGAVSLVEAQTASEGLLAGQKVGTVYTHENAELLYRQAKYSQAETLCKQALADIEKSKGDKAPAVAEPLIDLATVYMRQARFADAKAAIERADSVLDKSKPDQALIYGRLGINKSWRLYILGETEAAAKVCDEALDVLKKNKVTESKDFAELVNNKGLMDEELAEKNEDQDLMDKARLQLIQGWQMRRKVSGDDSPEAGESLNNLGMHLLYNSKNAAEMDLAINTLQKSLAVAKKVYGENHPETAVSHAALGLALYMTDQPDDAEKEIRLAMPMTEKYFGKMHPDMAYELSTLGRIMMDQSHFSEAEKDFAGVVSINEEVYGKTSPQVVPSLEALKRFYDDRREVGKSRDVQSRIESIKGKDI